MISNTICKDFENWLEEFFPDRETLMNNIFVKFPHEEYEIYITKNKILFGEETPYYCVSERFETDIYCFVKKVGEAA